MDAMSALEAEHKLILEFLFGLEEVLSRDAEPSESKPSSDYFRWAIGFGQRFVGFCHHDKEETAVFALLQNNHNPALDEHIRNLSRQHELNHDLLSDALKSLGGFDTEDDSSTSQLRCSLGQYIHNTRAHIELENEVFFPLVRNVVAAAESDRMEREFSRIDAELGLKYLSDSRSAVRGRR